MVIDYNFDRDIITIPNENDCFYDRIKKITDNASGCYFDSCYRIFGIYAG